MSGAAASHAPLPPPVAAQAMTKRALEALVEQHVRAQLAPLQETLAQLRHELDTMVPEVRAELDEQKIRWTALEGRLKNLEQQDAADAAEATKASHAKCIKMFDGMRHAITQVLNPKNGDEKPVEGRYPDKCRLCSDFCHRANTCPTKEASKKRTLSDAVVGGKGEDTVLHPPTFVSIV